MKLLSKIIERLRLRALKRKILNLFGCEIFYINGADRLPAPLSAEREAFLMEHIDDAPQARSELIEHNLRLVVYISRKFENTGINIEDLISIGTIGLIKAVNTFCPNKNIKLATYASRCIENEILMHLRKTSHSKTEVSIEEPLNVDWDGNELLLSDVIGTESDSVSKNIENETELMILNRALDTLSPREREITVLRFGLNGSMEYTQKEVADMLGISQSYISRLEKKILQHLKKELEKQI